MLSAWGVACNSTRDNSCVVPSPSMIGAGTAASTCEGTCESITLPDAGDASVAFCAIDCTIAGQSKCDFGRTCASLADLGVFDSGTSFCVHECAKDDGGNDAGACPSGYTCFARYGVCF